MKKNNKFGFTLVELLAVIVILAIILVIAVPQIMSTIEDAKKATLESTVMMIASSAEKAKVQNTLLNNNKGINCKDIVKINDIDYERCIIEFDDENNALVTIKGSGKFDNLYVCEGNKTKATASNENCEVSYGNASAYIEKLGAFTSDNGLIIDDTVDKNIRYVGSNPSNKVYFNCKDKDSNNVSYGENNYDYVSLCEVWRIIGVFDVDNGNGKVEKRVKLVRDALPVIMSFDSSVGGENIENSVNYGLGINQWGESTYEDGTYYEGADLMRMLNGYYIGKDSTCKYCNNVNQGICLNDCTSSVTPLSTISLKMIEDVLWNLGANGDVLSPTLLYDGERSTTNGKICEATSQHNGTRRCTDAVKRTTKWIGKIGLIYSSDYVYASKDAGCSSNIYGTNSTCKNNNWLYTNRGYWTISPKTYNNNSASLYFVYPDYFASHDGFGAWDVRPSLYLVSSVQIIGGDGNTTPYKLAI